MPRKGGVPENLKPCRPGETRNPSGRPKGYVEFNRLCREHSDEALAVVLSHLRSAVPSCQQWAADQILNRAWGKPAQPQTGEGGEGPIAFVIYGEREAKSPDEWQESYKPPTVLQ